ncbi:MAG: M23 family metallopeptidase [Proteobacteria bacterium]|nr:MAG: M23 family metallopeptidase [Pseudomonadota bacterium]
MFLCHPDSGRDVLCPGQGISGSPEIPEGNSIEIACEDPSGKVYTFRYAHLKQHSKKVKSGDPVEAGTVIAEVGNTGNTSWPHLHIDVMGTDGLGVPLFINERFLRAGELID